MASHELLIEIRVCVILHATGQTVDFFLSFFKRQFPSESEQLLSTTFRLTAIFPRGQKEDFKSGLFSAYTQTRLKLSLQISCIMTS